MHLEVTELCIGFGGPQNFRKYRKWSKGNKLEWTWVLLKSSPFLCGAILMIDVGEEVTGKWERGLLGICQMAVGLFRPFKDQVYILAFLMVFTQPGRKWPVFKWPLILLGLNNGETSIFEKSDQILDQISTKSGWSDCWETSISPWVNEQQRALPENWHWQAPI